MPLDSGIPRSLHGRAGEDLGKDDSDHPAQDKQPDGNHDMAERLAAEDEPVHEKNGELNWGQGESVEDVVDIDLRIAYKSLLAFTLFLSPVSLSRC